MNIETGQLKSFDSSDDLRTFLESLSRQERDDWVEIDPAGLTDKQRETMQVSSHDHRSELAVKRDILRRQKRSAKRKAKRESARKHDSEGEPSDV